MRQIGFGLLLLSDVTVEIRFGLVQGLFVWATIDFKQQVALFYFLAFLEMNPDQLASHLRFHGNCGI